MVSEGVQWSIERDVAAARETLEAASERVSERAERWAAIQRTLNVLEAESKSIEAELKEYFRANPHLRDVDGLVGYGASVSLRLDTVRVKAELGARLREFQRTVRSETLSLLRP